VLEQAGWSVLLLWMYATAGIINIHAPKKYGCVIADLNNKLFAVEFLKHLMNLLGRIHYIFFELYGHENLIMQFHQKVFLSTGMFHQGVVVAHWGSSGGSLVMTPDCKPAVPGSNPAISPAYSGLPTLGRAAIWDGTPL
jgi:hypothetical protein